MKKQILNLLSSLVLIIVLIGATNTFAGTNVYVSPPEAFGGGRCGPGVFQGFEAWSKYDGNTISWYATSTGGEPLSTEAWFTTPFLEESTTYYVAVDSAGHQSDRIAVEAIINPLPELNATVNHIKCNYEENGSILIEATGGTAPYSYKWGGAVYDQTGDYVNGLNPGQFSVTVTDANYCQSKIDTIVLNGSSAQIYDVVFDVQPSYNLTDSMEIVFDNMTSGADKYYWDFDDGNISTSNSPMHMYMNDGVYNVCLTASDSASGCAKTSCQELVVGTDFCKAKYSHSVTLVTKKATFTNTSLGTPTGYYWDFGDGTTSTEESPVHTYSNNGYYDVALTVIDTNAKCSNRYVDQVRVGVLNCNASFSHSVNPTTNEVSFLDESEGMIARYFWNFGDGNTSKMKNPSHMYDEAGMVYNVKLTVSTLSGLCVSRTKEDVAVGAINCSANYTYFVDPITQIVKFKSEAMGSNAMTYYWEFGDGYNSTLASPVHKFVATGYYYVSLVTFDEASGCMDYYSEIIMVGEIGNDCEAFFMYQPNGREVAFFDDSRGANLSSYLWNMGDGTILTDQNPTHTYSEDGFYNVCLTAVDPGTCKNTSCEKIRIGKPQKCLADFIYTVDTLNKSVSFKDKSLGVKDVAGLSYVWEFGDEQRSDSANPTHVYADTGFYKVKLSLLTSNGECISFSVDLISVAAASKNIRPVFDFLNGPVKKGIYPTDFTGAGYGTPASFSWSFGDGTGGDTTTLSPTYDYTAAGFYNVCLTISDPNTSQASTACDTVAIGIAGIRGDVAKKGELKIFPNPANDVLTMSYKNDNPVSTLTVVLYDSFGRAILQKVYSDKQVVNEQYNIVDLPAGLYFFNVVTDTHSVTRKVIVY